jgi:hypothetical protein
MSCSIPYHVEVKLKRGGILALGSWWWSTALYCTIMRMYLPYGAFSGEDLVPEHWPEKPENVPLANYGFTNKLA